MIYGIIYLLSIVFANLLISLFGVVTIAGITFPAGVIIVGLTFTARDFVQREFGKKKCWLWMIAACVISAIFNLDIALASISAFTVSELTDWLIFTYSTGSFKKRVILSNIFGITVDTVVFIPLLFGWNWSIIFGQIVIKFITSIVIILFIKK